MLKNQVTSVNCECFRIKITDVLPEDADYTPILETKPGNVTPQGH